MARILLVEDEFLIRLVLAEELMAAGHEVIEAASADEAMARTDGPYDILVTDLQMPGTLGGVELAERVRDRQSVLPVVYVTGRPEAAVKIGVVGERHTPNRLNLW